MTTSAIKFPDPYNTSTTSRTIQQQKQSQ